MTTVARRTRRFARRQEKLKRRPLLNLVAMMDVFTILVFFLLANYSETMLALEPDKVRLPESLAAQKPREAMVVTVTPQEIYVQGDRVASADSALDSSASDIAALRDALQERRLGKSASASQAAEEVVPEVTIMGDRAIPFSLLKKVMITCTKAGYGNISLSVLQRALPPG
ncbi:MAG: biopolymer transporter ExbD [Gammaproteobacteria bacterium]